jgi:hypothetical protein
MIVIMPIAKKLARHPGAGLMATHQNRGVIREKYERIKVRAGGKRAIIAIARTLLLRTRRMLIDNQPYVGDLVA